MPQNIGDNRVVENGIARISQEDAQRLGRYLVKGGDIVYSRRGDVERRALITKRENGWLCGTGCLRVRFGPNGPNPAFASYYLGHPQVREWIVRHAQGATMPNLNTAILSALPFIVPPRRQQDVIAEILQTLDDKIDLNTRMNETLEVLTESLLRAWLSEGSRRSGWTTGSILSQARLIGGGTPKTTVKDYWNGDVPWVAAKDVSQCDGIFVMESERTITPLGLDESNAALIPAFCTVVVARGATTGRMAMLGKDMAMNQTCYAFESLEGTPFTLYGQLRGMMRDLVQRAHGSVFNTITTDTVRTFNISLAPKPARESFEREVVPLYRRILANASESTGLRRVRDTLLPRLMSEN